MSGYTSIVFKIDVFSRHKAFCTLDHCLLDSSAAAVYISDNVQLYISNNVHLLLD